MDWYLAVLKKYVEFSGRARRKEYWMFYLFNFLITVGLVIVDGLAGLYSQEAGLGVLSGIYSLAVLLPSLGVLVRRLHDTNRSAWWLLIALIPFVGAIVLLVFTVLPGDVGSNRYGADPKSTIPPLPKEHVNALS